VIAPFLVVCFILSSAVIVREWFSFVMKRVPQMQEQRMREADWGPTGYVEGEEGADASKRNVQRPRAFYRRELEEQPFVIGRTSVQP